MYEGVHKLNNELMGQARKDIWYQECLKEVEERTAAFYQIREKLTEQEQEELDDYIAACEELQHSLIYAAFEIGKKHGRLER